MTVVLLDMDHPLADFDRRLMEIGQDRGWTFDLAGGQTERFLTQHMPVRAERRAAERLIEAPGWFASLPVTPGAPEGVEALLAAGVDLWVVTKPKESNPTCHTEKFHWLARHFPGLERRLVITPDKSLVHGDVLVDDAPKLAWLSRASWFPVIFEAPYNGPGSEWEDLTSWTWADGVDALLTMIGSST